MAHERELQGYAKDAIDKDGGLSSGSIPINTAVWFYPATGLGSWGFWTIEVDPGASVTKLLIAINGTAASLSNWQHVVTPSDRRLSIKSWILPRISVYAVGGAIGYSTDPKLLSISGKP